MRISSSTLKVWHSHCAAAALRQLAFTHEDRQPYTVGVAAHAALEALASTKKIKAARQAVAAMMMGRREFKGHLEPPYDPDRCMEGLRLATDWCDQMGLPVGKPEVGVAVDRDWELVDYGSDEYWYGQLLDLVRVYEDEDEDGEPLRVLSVRDYKTAWNATEKLLDGLQMRGAFVLGAALAARENCQAVEVQIANLRRIRLYPEEPRRLYPGRPHHAYELKLWREEIDLAVSALRELAGRDPEEVASPGLGCGGCPYLGRCQAAEEHHGSGVARDPDLAELARIWVLGKAISDDTESFLRAHAEETGAIPLPDGLSELGFKSLLSSIPRENAVAMLATLLGWSEETEGWVLSMRPGARQIQNLISALWEQGFDGDKIRELKAAALQKVRTRQWGAWRKVDTDE